MTNEDLVRQFLASGGRITKVKNGTPKDLKAMIRGYGLFGGKRSYVATLSQRQDSGKGNLFAGIVAKPTTGGRNLKYVF